MGERTVITVDRSKMNKIPNPAEFKSQQRELLLDYKTYEENFNDHLDTFDVLKKTLANPSKDAKPIHFMNSTHQRAIDTLDHLTNCYSAGHTLSELSNFYPATLEYWESYANFSDLFNKSPECSNTTAAHFSLFDMDYDRVNRMVCLGILLSHGELIPRLLPIFDYNNPERDGLLERVLAFYVDDRGPPPDECTRHLPYFKTLKIFAAPKNERSELMAEYLEDWYEASRREWYYDSHERGLVFLGYWSWEAAAITYLLDINDSSYRDAQFYPKDLVDFARQLDKETKDAMPVPEQERQRLRVEGGQPCTQAGYWFTPAKQSSRRQFKKGETMPVIQGSQYGATIWQWAKEQ
jgi:hypothetical protein